ncbi:PD-(D/E)XK motif protein [Myxococcota bacterium]|nr:PD-(D/E)XK motif protein [Myxococcota bacterium]MCK6565935.1 PD-(D/E)XK motif protein [Dehalococcoidia bacterium]
MAPRSERDELAEAWRALRGLADGPGWRTIPVCAGGPCRFFAGRQTPGDEEALLVDMGGVPVRAAVQLPQGRGFAVIPVVVEATAPSAWIGISRRPGGSMDLFAAMAADIVQTLHGVTDVRPANLLGVLLDRIRAWQRFMDRGGDGVLGAEAEIGLLGELVLIGKLVDAGVAGLTVCEGWEGPRDGVQDFRWRSGAMEVKTSSAPLGSFPARIGSIDQLDDTNVQPLFLAAVRVTEVESGRTLPEWVAGVRERLVGQDAALGTFNDRVLQGGYSDAQADRYTRRFEVRDVRIFTVNQVFPRLTRSTVPGGITEARYQMDLDLVRVPATDLPTALSRIGVL